MNKQIQYLSDITVRLIQEMGGDYMVVAAARVSTSGADCVQYAQQDKAEESYGLIRYLMNHRHGTPFEHSALTFFVHAPIFVFREWHRHRVGFSYNEESGRYKELDPVFWVPRETRNMVPALDFKPARPKFMPADAQQYAQTLTALKLAYETSYSSYRTMLDDYKVSREIARSILPVGIYSSCWVTCNPRSLMHFLSLRTHEPTAKFVSYPQAEIAEAASTCEQIFSVGWPLTYKAYNECGRIAP